MDDKNIAQENKEDERKHEHGHPHDPVRKITPQLPEYVLRMIALGESLYNNQVVVVEDTRLKLDELQAKGLSKNLPYYEKRFLMLKETLIDRGVVSREDVECELQETRQSNQELSHFDSGVVALSSLLLRKGVLKKEQLEKRYHEVRARTPMTGAKIVARAWTDPDFKAELLRDPKNAIMKWDPNLLTPNSGEPVEMWRDTGLEVLENTEKVRNVIVCTLCSCYPRGILGEPPEWYTSDSYKQRVLSEPRNILRDNGVQISDDVEIRVYDSTSDVRYMVLPLRPGGTEGMSVAELEKLVTRDSLIGVIDSRP